jgi:hypothetical protein
MVGDGIGWAGRCLYKPALLGLLDLGGGDFYREVAKLLNLSVEAAAGAKQHGLCAQSL